MMTASAQIAARQAPAHAAIGFEAGTEVMTLTGIRPVETLRRGDRIITRYGARPLRALETRNGGYLMQFDSPQVVLLAEGQAHSDSGLPYAA